MALKVGLVLSAALLWVYRAAAAVVGLPAWDVVASPEPSERSELRGVAVVAPGQIWAVGYRGPRSLTTRWNGTAFVGIPSPNVTDRATVLEDVDGIATSDVWAVGHTDQIDSVASRTFVIHWNGFAWSRVASPNGPAGNEDVLSGVAAIAENDAWAVGWSRSFDPASVRALTLHWNGLSWTKVSNPCGPYLRGVVALSATNVWAVGGKTTCRWNGSTWVRRDAAPAFNPDVSIDLQDITAVSAGNLWAVGIGTTSCGEGVCQTGVIEHWNGSAWSFRSTGALLYGVDATGTGNVYAVGLGLGPAVLHYDGSAWSSVPIPTPTPVGRLLAVDTASGGASWAVGLQFESGQARTLAERAPSPHSGAVVGSTGVGNATVSWFGPETGSNSSDQFGRYQIGGLDAGQYTLIATFQGCSPYSKQVQVKAGTTIGIALPVSC
jgi:hypothetical protein